MGALLAGVAVGLLAKPTLAGPSPTPPGVDGGLKAPRRVESPVPKYPKDARRAGLAGLVVLECAVDRRGQVVKAEVRDGVPPLTDAAVEAVKQWRYEPALLDGVPVTATITVKVRFLPEELRYDGLLGSLRHRNEQIRESAARWLGQLRVGGALGEEDVQETARALQRLVEGDESPWVRATAARSLEHLVGPPLPPAAPPADMFDTPRDVSWGVFVDPALQCDFVDRGDWIEIGVPAGPYDLNIENGQMAAPRVLQPVEGDLVAQVTVAQLAEPTYPREAHDKRIQGIVMVEILIDTEGRVARSRVIQSVPELDAAALAGVEAWRFKPAIRGGTPVPTTARAPIVFRLE